MSQSESIRRLLRLAGVPSPERLVVKITTPEDILGPKDS